MTESIPSSPTARVRTGSASPWRQTLRQLRASRMAVTGILLLLLVVLFCFVGPLAYPTDQVSTNLVESMLPPGPGHPLGTDNVGYDVLGRLMLGGQTSLIIGLAAATMATVFGTIWGALAGLSPAWLDAIMMRVVDIVLSIPALFLLLLVASIIPPSVPVLIVVVAALAWLVPARLIRGNTLTLRTRDYVVAARGMGAGPFYALRRHILPNAVGTIAVNGTFQIADAILAVAAISFLGLGVPAPATDWGGMLTTGVNYLYAGAWWLIYPPGILIIVTVLAFNFLGEAIDDAAGGGRVTGMEE
jgi:peptide/nickel transport system permease protein